MAIQFGCPNCAMRYSINENSAGRQLECKKCGESIRVPTSTSTTSGSSSSWTLPAAEADYQPKSTDRSPEYRNTPQRRRDLVSDSRGDEDHEHLDGRSIWVRCPCGSDVRVPNSGARDFILRQCRDCGRELGIVFAKIRAKRSQGYRRQFRRFFSVRVYLPSGGEDLIQFWSNGYEDFELRQGDEVAFVYVNNEVHSVVNLNISRDYSVHRGLSGSCFIATCVFGEESPQTKALREFRDTRLMPFAIGQLFVWSYLQIAPTLVSQANFAITRWSARTVLLPIVSICNRVNKKDERRNSWCRSTRSSADRGTRPCTPFRSRPGS